MRLLSEALGFLAMMFVAFLLLAAPVAILISGLLLPVLLPPLIPVVVIFAVLANLLRKYHDWLDSM